MFHDIVRRSISNEFSAALLKPTVSNVMVYERAPRESKYMYAFEERLRLMSDEQASP
jgi:hypothetical protein